MNGPPDTAVESSALVELGSRLVYSLLRAAVRVAARFRMPMNRVVELVQLAYFEEHRNKSPRDLNSVAEDLGLSLRSVGSLNRKYKGDFFKAERQVEPLRQVTSALLGKALTIPEVTALTGLAEAEVRRMVSLLDEHGWVTVDDEMVALGHGLRSWVSEDGSRRLDGLNNQMDVLTQSVWSSFVHGNTTTARARSWVFAARPQDIEAFIESHMKTTRHHAVDLEEAALSDGNYARYGVTVAVAPMETDDGTD